MLNDKIPLNEMIQTLREELEKAQKNAENSDLKFKLESAEIELSIGVTKTGGGSGGIKFWVIEAGGEFSKENAITHKFTLHLKPTSSSGEVQIAKKSLEPMSDD